MPPFSFSVMEDAELNCYIVLGKFFIKSFYPMNQDPKGKSAVPSNLSSLISYNLMSQKLKLLDYAVCLFCFVVYQNIQTVVLQRILKHKFMELSIFHQRGQSDSDDCLSRYLYA